MSDRNNSNASGHIDSFIKTYFDAVNMFGIDDVIDALREHYSDVCSNGDAIINDIIDALDKHRDASIEDIRALS